MRCPYCNAADSRVTDSRDSAEGIRRRRQCLQCGLRFTTYERVQTAALSVVKRDGRREEFNREKLLRSVQVACAKRPLPLGALERIVEDIEERVQQLGRAEVPSATIGEMVVARLKELDRVAYIRFASVYRDFADIESFKQEIEDLLAAREAARGQVPSNQLTLIPLVEPPRPAVRRRGRPPRAQPAGQVLDIKAARRQQGA